MKEFQPSLSTKLIGTQIIFFPSISSTNNYLLNEYDGPLKEGLVVIADYQTAGRGRQKREWFATSGQSLLFSILLLPDSAPKTFPQLTQVIALAIVIVLEKKYSLNPQIKWPNDIFINGKKCCGILSESTVLRNSPQLSVIIGVGLNVNQCLTNFSDELIGEATSLFMETEEEWDREELFYSLLSEIDNCYKRWLSGSFSRILEEIGLRFYLKGKTVEVQQEVNGLLRGEVVGLSSQGHLLIKSVNGQLSSIISGDIKVCC